jgi:uncharacterized membrane protein YGL010W
VELASKHIQKNEKAKGQKGLIGSTCWYVKVVGYGYYENGVPNGSQTPASQSLSLAYQQQ